MRVAKRELELFPVNNACFFFLGCAGVGNTGGVREDTSINFFRPVCTLDEKTRKQALGEILHLLYDSLKKDRNLIKAHLARVVRFAYETPFKDLEEGFKSLLQQIENLNVRNIFFFLFFFFFFLKDNLTLSILH